MAGTSGVGYCKLVIEDATGKTLRDDDDLYIICRSGRPDDGNWIRLPDLGRYFVDRVEFEPEPGIKNRNFAHPVLFLRPEGAPRTSPQGGGGGGKPRSLFPSNHSGTRKVIPFERPSTPPDLLRAWLLPPSLIANLVSVAYREQASDFDDDRRVAAALLRTPDGEFLKETLPAIFDALSREAKHHATQSLLFFSGQLHEDRRDETAPEKHGPTGKVLEFRRSGEEWSITDAA